MMLWAELHLTHCGLVTPYGDISVNLQHQAIIWTNADLSSVRSRGIHLREFSQENPEQ